MKSLILASGFGTRLYPLTMSQPKGLIQYKGKPIINHIVDKIPEDVEILVNTNKKFEPVFRLWQDSLERNVTLCVEPVLNETQSFGAVGSLAYWAKDINDDLLVLACDNYFGFDMSAFISAYDENNTLVAVCDVGDRNKACQFGVVQIECDRITALEEKPLKPKSGLVATACYLFPPRVFNFICEFAFENGSANLGSLIAHLVNKDKVFAYVFSNLWFDIGTPDCLSQLVESGEANLPGSNLSSSR